MNDIFGIGKVLPIDKLIDIVSQVTGRVSKPYFDKKDIDTKAYEITKLAEAKAEEMKIISCAIKENFIGSGTIEYKENGLTVSSPKELLQNKTPEIEIIPTPSLQERTSERINFKEGRKQLNIESITANAAEELRDEPPVSNEPIDEDWSTRFFNIAEDISNDDMQAIWGRILAGEIKNPKSYSLRTLEILKNLTKKEAETFMKFADFAITSSNTSFILSFEKEKLLKETYKLNLNERLLLEELGFLNSTELSFVVKPSKESKENIYFTIGNTIVSLEKPPNQPEQNFSILVFTKIGQELLKLVQSNPNLDYIKLLASKIRKEGYIIKYGNILKRFEDGRINHTFLIDVPLTDEELKKKKEKEERENKK